MTRSSATPAREDRLSVLDLFSGIGGFSLGLERTGGFETVAFCEIDPFCRRVLAKHWPNVKQYEDVRELTAERLRADGIVPDVICGGFPCQDISVAGKGGGIEGERSGLWSEYARLIGEIRPRIAIVENVAALLNRGLDRVLGDLAALGFDAEWHCIPASYVGAHHIRDRLWIIAHPIGSGTWMAEYRDCGSGRQSTGTLEPEVLRQEQRPGRPEGIAAGSRDVPNANCKSVVGTAIARAERPDWNAEPSMARVVDGVPHRLVANELRTLGNAVVPQIPELIGRAILASDARRSA